MVTDAYIVVADKFADFTVNDRTITQSHLKALFALPDHLLPERARVVLGQGVSDAERAEIVALVEGSENNRRRWDIDALKGCRAGDGEPVAQEECVQHPDLPA